MNSANISIIIPTLNESACIERCLLSTAAIPGAEIIISDGGSSDGTIVAALDAAAALNRPIIVQGPRGRGAQLKAGALRASGDTLVFLHADTILPPNAGQLITEFYHSSAQAATFRLRFTAHSPLLRLFALCARLDSPFTRFGDQTLVIRHDFYRALGGFADIPLLEDVEFFARIKRRARLMYLPGYVTTQARRFERRGALRQQFDNARTLWRYWRGTDPAVLFAEYYADPHPAAPDDIISANLPPRRTA